MQSLTRPYRAQTRPEPTPKERTRQTARQARASAPAPYPAQNFTRTTAPARPVRAATSRRQTARTRAPSQCRKTFRAKPLAKPALQCHAAQPRAEFRAQTHQLAQSRAAIAPPDRAHPRPSQYRKTFRAQPCAKPALQCRAAQSRAEFRAQPRRATPCRASRGHIARGRYVYIIAHIARKCET